ncbi:PREDICTED: nucleolar protein 8-like [Branchiostoma belcheri]|uniref:Nucleolar protein 8-like n=1 Tax=Branchiostoma belcheri TaxID=7741 RepID=A0A6P4ZHN9_BRABE|nr:PREDICTED: nucleolar protein 8-like [Branchiostoma belcheri]
MAKDTVKELSTRLYVGGLFCEVTDADLIGRFEMFGQVSSVDIVRRTDDKGKPERTFAYVNLTTTDQKLKKCMAVYNKSKWKGHDMQIQVAKESFLARLAKEREATKMELSTKKLSPERPEPSPARQWTVQGAVPGTEVEGERNWVVGKYGRILPVVYIRRKDKKKVMKVNPSKYSHNLKKVKEEHFIDPPISQLTWDIQVQGTEESRKKRQGDFSDFMIGRWKRPAATLQAKNKKMKVELGNKSEENLSNSDHSNPDTSSHIGQSGDEKDDKGYFAQHEDKTSAVGNAQSRLDDSDNDSDSKELSNTTAIDKDHDDDDSDFEVVSLEQHDQRMTGVLDGNMLLGFKTLVHNKQDGVKGADDSDRSVDTDELLTATKHHVVQHTSMEKTFNSGTASDPAEMALSSRKKLQRTINTQDVSRNSSSKQDSTDDESEDSDDAEMIAAARLKLQAIMSSPRTITNGKQVDKDGGQNESARTENKATEQLLDETRKDSSNGVGMARLSQEQVDSDTSYNFSQQQSDDGSSSEDTLNIPVKTSGKAEHGQKTDKRKDDGNDIDDDEEEEDVGDSNNTDDDEEEEDFDDGADSDDIDDVEEDVDGNDIDDEEDIDDIDDGEEEDVDDIDDDDHVVDGADDVTDDGNDIDDDEEEEDVGDSNNTDDDEEEEDFDDGVDGNDIDDDNEDVDGNDIDDDDDIDNIDDGEEEDVDDIDDDDHVVDGADDVTGDEGDDDDDEDDDDHNDELEDDESPDSDSTGESLSEPDSVEENETGNESSSEDSSGPEIEDKIVSPVKPSKSPNGTASTEDLNLLEESANNGVVSGDMSSTSTMDIRKGPADGQKLKSSAVANEQRLESLRQRQLQGQSKQALISKALSTMVSSTAGKHTVFDSEDEDSKDGTEVREEDWSSTTQPDKAEEKTSQMGLFESDSEEDSDSGSEDSDDQRFQIKPQFEGKTGEKLLELQAQIGQDDRFRMDHRFLEEDSDEEEQDMKKTPTPTEETDGDLEAERQKSLEILRRVVGTKAAMATEKGKNIDKLKFKDPSAVRYDPTREDHKQFEIPDNESQKDVEESGAGIHEEAPPEETVPNITKDKYFQVATDLKEAFSGTGGQTFSFFGPSSAETTEDIEADMASESTQTAPKKSPWQPKVFQYDSSDDDDDDEMTQDDLKKIPEKVEEPKKRNSFFFAENDSRLKEGILQFYRTDKLEDIRQAWEEVRPELLEESKKRHKNAVRQRKKNQKNKPRHRYK